MKLRDVRDLLLLACLWGCSFPFMRIAAPQFGPVPLVVLRVGIGALLMLPFFLRQRAALSARQMGHIAVVGVVNTAIPFALLAYATLSVTAGFAAILNATTPLFGALVAWLWLKEGLSRARFAGLFVGFFGVVFLVWGKASFKTGPTCDGLAILAALLATFCYGVGTNYSKRMLPGVPSPLIAGGSMAAAFLFLAIPAWFFFPRVPVSAHAWLAAGGLGIFCTGMAYLLFYRLVAHAGAARAMSVTFLVPIFAMAIGIFFLHEAVTLRMALACGVILLGTGFATGLIGSRLRN